MNEKSLEFLKKEFRWYYFNKSYEIEEPSRMEEREFGYMTFNKVMVRHLSLKNKGELMALLLKEVPMSVYYSSSYYLAPNLPMEKKGWKGSDLIFDIDADELDTSCKKEHDRWTCKNCEYGDYGKRPELCLKCNSLKIEELKWSCDLCMGKAKGEVFKLLDILEEDFGLSKKEIKIYFSGNMGYHIHIQSPLVEDLNQDCRSEIVDYLNCSKLDIKRLGLVDGLRYEELIQRVKALEDYGWGRRILRIVGEKNLCEILIKDYKKALKVIKELMEEISVKLDREVTIDLHRIFRLPGSLNQKSGLIKKEVKNLDSFDPYEDTLAFNDEEVKIKVKFSPKFKLKGKIFGPYKDEVLSLPKYAAIFLIARGVAEIEGGGSI